MSNLNDDNFEIIEQVLEGIGLTQYLDSFKQHAIDDPLIFDVTTNDLEQIGISILGHQKKIIAALHSLQVEEISPKTKVNNTSNNRKSRASSKSNSSQAKLRSSKEAHRDSSSNRRFIKWKLVILFFLGIFYASVHFSPLLQQSTLDYLLCLSLFSVLSIFGIIIGDVLCEFARPEWVLVRGNFVDILRTKIFWIIGPQSIACIVAGFITHEIFLKNLSFDVSKESAVRGNPPIAEDQLQLTETTLPEPMSFEDVDLEDDSMQFSGASTIGSGEELNAVPTIPDPQIVEEPPYLDKPFFGITARIVQLNSDDHAEYKSGAVVGSIDAGSQAERIGLSPGDVILKIDQYLIESERDLASAILSIGSQANEKKQIQFLRGQELLSVSY